MTFRARSLAGLSKNLKKNLKKRYLQKEIFKALLVKEMMMRIFQKRKRRY